MEAEQVGAKQTLGPGDQSWETVDGILAFALYLSGHTHWPINSYTVEMLRRLGFGGMKPREAALAAVSRGKKGNVRFVFDKYPPAQLLNIFTEQENQFKDELKREGRDVFKTVLEAYKAGDIEFEELTIRLVCILLKMRIDFMNAWKYQVPMLRLANPGETERETRGDSTIVTYPGFTEVAANASKETFERLGL